MYTYEYLQCTPMHCHLRMCPLGAAGQRRGGTTLMSALFPAHCPLGATGQ